MLVASEFSRELTTTVLWLNERGLDIRCVRLKPYSVGTVVLADVQQLIPLPEAEEYQVSLREKRRETRRAVRPRASPEEITARLAPDARAAAEELCRWVDSFGPEWRSGAAGFSPILTIGGAERRFFRVREDGVLVIRFDSLSDTPPFEREEVREELRRRLNAIPGVSIDRIEGRPHLPLAALVKPDAMRALQEVLGWAIEAVRQQAG